MSRSEIRIGDRAIGQGNPTFIIAEAGVNHNGNPDLARDLVDAAAKAGADAVKFQTFDAERLATFGTPKAEYQKQRTAADESHLEMLRRLELSLEVHADLMAYCQTRKILFLSTPFDEERADFLHHLGVIAFKIPSGEITNLPFLAHVARKRKPMMISTGMANLGEVEAAVRAIQEAGNREFVLLHCVSNYPANPSDANLRAMHTLAAAFGAPAGYSDHTTGIEVALAAVALGACVVEKHVTLDRTLPGPDHASSLEPEELAGLVGAIRIVESALGHGRKEPVASELETARIIRRSLVAASHIPVGAVLRAELIALRRPGTGLPPAMRTRLVGLTAKRDIPAGTLLTMEMFS